MSPIVIISVVTALIAVYLYLNLSDEIPRLFALGIAAMCFVLDIALAPWPVQLLILGLVLAGSRTLSPLKL
ncbi:MAG: hypothetical protein J7641_14285 [Cyanobacteria bacterium SID2]|nr:hypothetical protein [Cyanobacteria bacterium SID2]